MINQNEVMYIKELNKWYKSKKWKHLKDNSFLELDNVIHCYMGYIMDSIGFYKCEYINRKWVRFG